VTSTNIARIAARAGTIAIVGAAACAQNGVATQAPKPAVCTGEPYVDIQNTTNEPVDLYADYNDTRVFIGTASATDTRMSLVGTILETRQGFVYAVPRTNAATPAGLGTSRVTSPTAATPAVKVRMGCDLSRVKAK
jgi:hypothetical protein